MAKVRDDFRKQVRRLIRDGAIIIKPDDYDDLIDRALEAYSKKVPRPVVLDLPSDGSGDFPISSLTGFDEEFSGDPEIEYPISNAGDEPSMIDRRDWKYYRKPAPVGLVIRLFGIPNGNQVRFTFKAPHSITDTDSTPPQSDFNAICKLAAAEGCDDLSRHYTQTSESSFIQADQAIYQSKAREYESRAKKLREQFSAHVGAGSQEEGPPAASVTKNWDTRNSRGGDRLTHPRRFR